MKKTIITIGIALMTLGVSAQSLNGVNINELPTDYIEIVGIANSVTKKLKVKIDAGQGEYVRGFVGKSIIIKDEKGKTIHFRTMIEAVVFFEKYRYELKFTNLAMNASEKNFHYLMKK